MPINSEERARIARENGAKSKGPKTAEGWVRCQTAAKKAAEARKALTFECTLLPTESRHLRDTFAAAELAYWQPSTHTELQMVHEIIDINWRIRRIRYAQTHELQANMESQRHRSASKSLSIAMVAQAEVEGSAANGVQPQLDRRVDRLIAVRSRLMRDLDRSKKRHNDHPGSQPALETQHLNDEFAWRVPVDSTSENDADLAAEAAEGSEGGRAQALTYSADPETLIVEPEVSRQPETPEAEPENQPDILTWAEKEVGFTPDPFQADLLTSDAKNILVLGGRQTGKSTAAAVRVVYEAVFHHGQTILLAGPTGRQSGQIMEKARKIVKSLGLATGAPPPGCDGFKLANGSHILSLPDSEATIRGFSAPRLIVVDEAAFASDELFKALQPMLAVSNGAMILLSTPNGQSGFFYERWHDEPCQWRRIQCKAADCARINPDALESIRRFMTKEEFSQEFDCEFTAAPGQFITREMVRKCIHPDVKPLFEDDTWK